MKIGILATGHVPDTLRDRFPDYPKMFADLLAGHGFEFAQWNVVDGEFPSGAQEADGWLITGSKHGAYEDHPWIAPLEELIREIDTLGRPLIGVCFGHQIIAQALGGKVEKFSGGWSVGRTDYEIEGQVYAIHAWHQDQVTELPPRAEVIGGTDFCPYAALRYGDAIWTVQPHPEFSDEYLAGLVRTRGKGVVPQALLDGAMERLAQPVDRSAITERMAQFFKEGSAP